MPPHKLGNIYDVRSNLDNEPERVSQPEQRREHGSDIALFDFPAAEESDELQVVDLVHVDLSVLAEEVFDLSHGPRVRMADHKYQSPVPGEVQFAHSYQHFRGMPAWPKHYHQSLSVQRGAREPQSVKNDTGQGEGVVEEEELGEGGE